MAKVSAYQCDACDEVRLGDRDEPPVGFRGTVAEVQSTGGIASAKWFACSLACVHPAIVEVVNRQWKRSRDQ